MSGFSYDRYDNRRRTTSSRNRSVLGYWVPFLVTATLATGALAAWVLRAREDGDSASNSSDDEDLSYGGDTDREREGIRPPSHKVSEGVVREEHAASTSAREDSTLLGRVQSTIRRTPSPQQLFDGASKRVVASVAAASAAVGGALSAIREDREDDYADHERWRDESRGVSASKRSAGAVGARRRTVAVVVSADEGDMMLGDDEDKGWKSEHAVGHSA